MHHSGQHPARVTDDSYHPSFGAASTESEKSYRSEGRGVGNGQRGCIRYLISVLAALTFFSAMTARASMNVAIVAMVNSTFIPSVNETVDECPARDSNSSQTVFENGEFNWSPDAQNQVLSAFYYGYVITQLPGGYLAERFGSKLIMAWMLLSSSILCTISPILARYDVRALIVNRFLLGLFQGPLYPSFQAVWGLWAPPLERTRLMAIAGSGSTLGDLVGLALTGLLSNSNILDGWPFPFYIFGGLNFACLVAWLFIYNDPLHQRYLSDGERSYIINSIYHEKGIPRSSCPPWKSILTSPPFYGILLFTTLNGMSYYIIFICGPTYMKQILHFDISENGLLNAAPYLSNLLICLIVGPVADFIMTKKWLSVTMTRKAFTLTGGLFSAGFTAAMGYADCNGKLAVLFLILAWGMGGLISAGPGISSLDISPQHAGTVMGILNTFSNVGGFISPILVLHLTGGKPSHLQWQKVFFLSAGLTGSGTFFYTFLGSSKEQNWNSAECDPCCIQPSDTDERQPLLGTVQHHSSSTILPT